MKTRSLILSIFFGVSGAFANEYEPSSFVGDTSPGTGSYSSMVKNDDGSVTIHNPTFNHYDGYSYSISVLGKKAGRRRVCRLFNFEEGLLSDSTLIWAEDARGATTSAVLLNKNGKFKKIEYSTTGYRDFGGSGDTTTTWWVGRIEVYKWVVCK